MRAVWRQTTRPKLSSRAAPRDSILSRAARINPLRHRPGFNDFFAIFLAPVLAAATMVNVSWKDKQMKDWEKKSAEIDHEIALLRAREQEIWARIQLQSIQKGLAAQRRSYSTAAVPGTVEPQVDAKERTAEQYEELNPLPLEDEDLSIQQAENPQPENTDGLDVPPPEDLALERFERLIAYRLALQMLLHVHIGGNPKYGEVEQREYFESRELPWNVNQMVRRLKEVTAELASMRSISAERRRSRPTLRHSSPFALSRLNAQLFRLGAQFKEGAIQVDGLVERFATIVMTTPTTPDIRTYTALVHILNYVEEEDLSYLVLTALKDSALLLDQRAVHTLLWRYGKSRDIQRLDSFLRELTKTNGRVQDPWEWRRANGSLIPVPSSFSSLICARLIAVALSCDQPDRAEAWASVMAEERPSHIRLLMVMKHFLQHFCWSSNWEKGKLWIAKAIEFGRQWDRLSTSNFKNPDQQMQLTILRILDLCMVCGREHIYSTIFQAAVDAGIEPPVLAAARPQFSIPAHVRIIQDWEDACQESAQSQDLRPMDQRILAFSHLLTPLAEELKRTKMEPGSNKMPLGVVSSDSLTSSVQAPTQHELIEQQRILIKALQEEIALSSRVMEDERRRIAQSRQQDAEAAVLRQQQIETLQQELKSFTSQQIDSGANHDPKLMTTITQQAASIEGIQTQVNQLIELMSQRSVPEQPPNHDQKYTDEDSGYGSDSASEPDPSSPTWWSPSDAASNIQIPKIDAQDSLEAPTRTKPFYVQRIRLRDDQRASISSGDQPLQSLSARPKLSRAPFKNISELKPSDDISGQSSPSSPPFDSSPSLSSIDLSRLPKSQRLLLTSFRDWLQWYRVASGRSSSLRRGSLSELLELTHTDLIDAGIVIDETRNFMLKDLRALAKFEPAVLERARQEARQSQSHRQDGADMQQVETESVEKSREEEQEALAEDGSSSSSSSTSSTSNPSMDSVLRTTILNARVARNRAARLRAKAYQPAAAPVSWNLSQMQESSLEFRNSWQETVAAAPPPTKLDISRSHSVRTSTVESSVTVRPQQQVAAAAAEEGAKTKGGEGSEDEEQGHR